MKHLVSRLAVAGAVALSVMAAPAAHAAYLARSDIVVAMQLEPPHLDPTSAAAGAIDSVLYSNVFEGVDPLCQ